ncbi:formin-binding protein 1-like isoform X2 [Culicoides brevitarsis]|uniref:formin-binding protein 1-like isoform X2 n=1 Tax=Culicoides brevitarsis TaxID=469753 RepID=UPI00307BFF8F
MSWGNELWDQYDNISSHTHKGIEFLDKYGSFVRDRCAIEIDYAAKLRRLVKNYQPKKKEEEDSEFTSFQSFRNVLKEIGDLAGQREVVAENLQQQVLSGINLLSKNLRDERKKALQEGQTLTQNLQAHYGALERAKRNYEKAYRDAEKAVENYQKADADLNLSRAEVEKQRHNMNMKCAQSDDAKNEYANQLQKLNRLQSVHFETALPDVFNRLQEIDEKRTRGLKEFIKGAADVEASVAPIISRCLEGIVKASESINEKEDSIKVIERYQSGFMPPNDVPFEDLSKMDTNSQHSSNAVGGTNVNHMTSKGTVTANKLKKRVGIFGIFGSNKEDFSDLPPTQRRKKLAAKVQELTTKVQQEQAARDGLMKMKGVYEANSVLGDPMTVEKQLNESNHNLEKLKQELRKYQHMLEQATNQSILQQSPKSATRQNHTQNGQRGSRHSNGSEHHDHHHSRDGEDQPDDAGSLSRSASENSVTKTQNGIESNNQPESNINGSSASPESGLGTSHTSLPGSGQGSASEQINDDHFYDPEPLQPLGTCRALYPFEASSEGSIPIKDGEELHVIELDQGDGWTRVRRMNEWTEGFVPTTYIEITLFVDVEGVDHLYVNIDNKAEQQ